MINIFSLFHQFKSCQKCFVKIFKQFRLYFLKFSRNKSLSLMLYTSFINHLDQRRNFFFLIGFAIDIIPKPMRTLKKFIKMFAGKFVFFRNHTSYYIITKLKNP